MKQLNMYILIVIAISYGALGQRLPPPGDMSTDSKQGRTAEIPTTMKPTFPTTRFPTRDPQDPEKSPLPSPEPTTLPPETMPTDEEDVAMTEAITKQMPTTTREQSPETPSPSPSPTDPPTTMPPETMPTDKEDVAMTEAITTQMPTTTREQSPETPSPSPSPSPSPTDPPTTMPTDEETADEETTDEDTADEETPDEDETLTPSPSSEPTDPPTLPPETMPTDQETTDEEDVAITEAITTQMPTTTREQSPETPSQPPPIMPQTRPQPPPRPPPPPPTPSQSSVFNIQISANDGTRINLKVTSTQEQRDNSISIIFTFETNGNLTDDYVMRCEATISRQHNVHTRRLTNSAVIIDRLQENQIYMCNVIQVQRNEVAANSGGMAGRFVIGTIAITKPLLCSGEAIAMITVAVILLVVMVIVWVIMCIVLCKRRSKKASFSPSKYDTTDDVPLRSHTPITHRPLPSPQHSPQLTTFGQTYEIIPGSTYEYIVGGPTGSFAMETTLSSENMDYHRYHVLEKTVPEKSKTVSNVENQVTNDYADSRDYHSYQVLEKTVPEKSKTVSNVENQVTTDDTDSTVVENGRHTYYTIQDMSTEHDSQLTEGKGSQGVKIVVPPQEPLEYELPRNLLRENQVTDTADAVVENAGHTSITIQDKSTEQTLTHSQEISSDSPSKESQGSQSCAVPTVLQ